jgi:hypothetical protein
MKTGLKGGAKIEYDRVISLYRTYVIASAEAIRS